MSFFINYQVSSKLINLNRCKNHFTFKKIPKFKVCVNFLYKQKSIILLFILFLSSIGITLVLIWRNRVKSHRLKVQKQLLEHEMNLLDKEKVNTQLLETQVKMQNILLLNVEQYRKHSIKRPSSADRRDSVISPILNITFHEELIACMDIEYNNISKRLLSRFPELTERDILICCLLLANFDTGMIATILDVKIESVTKHRYRLRTKLGMPNSDNLLEFLRSFWRLNTITFLCFLNGIYPVHTGWFYSAPNLLIYRIIIHYVKVNVHIINPHDFASWGFFLCLFVTVIHIKKWIYEKKIL